VLKTASAADFGLKNDEKKKKLLITTGPNRLHLLLTLIDYASLTSKSAKFSAPVCIPP